MTGVEYMQGLFRDTAAMTKDAIAKGDDISMELACKWIWYLHGLTAGAKLADYTCEADRLIAQAMQDEFQQLETEYIERLRENMKRSFEQKIVDAKGLTVPGKLSGVSGFYFSGMYGEIYFIEAGKSWDEAVLVDVKHWKECDGWTIAKHYGYYFAEHEGRVYDKCKVFTSDAVILLRNRNGQHNAANGMTLSAFYKAHQTGRLVLLDREIFEREVKGYDV